MGVMLSMNYFDALTICWSAMLIDPATSKWTRTAGLNVVLQPQPFCLRIAGPICHHVVAALAGDDTRGESFAIFNLV